VDSIEFSYNYDNIVDAVVGTIYQPEAEAGMRGLNMPLLLHHLLRDHW
jgi:hypothetical protein